MESPSKRLHATLCKGDRSFRHPKWISATVLFMFGGPCNPAAIGLGWPRPGAYFDSFAVLFWVLLAPATVMAMVCVAVLYRRASFTVGVVLIAAGTGFFAVFLLAPVFAAVAIVGTTEANLSDLPSMAFGAAVFGALSGQWAAIAGIYGLPCAVVTISLSLLLSVRHDIATAASQP